MADFDLDKEYKVQKSGGDILILSYLFIQNFNQVASQ